MVGGSIFISKPRKYVDALILELRLLIKRNDNKYLISMLIVELLGVAF